MRGGVLSAVLLLALASSATEPVGVPVSAVTVSLESVTIPIESITVKAQNLIAYQPQTQAELAERVRAGSSEASRVNAMSSIQDQEEIFRLIFKPGEDANTAVRIAAIDRIAEIDIVRIMAVKSPIQAVRECAQRRLESVYANASDRTVGETPSVVKAYAHRLLARLK